MQSTEAKVLQEFPQQQPHWKKAIHLKHYWFNLRDSYTSKRADTLDSLPNWNDTQQAT